MAVLITAQYPSGAGLITSSMSDQAETTPLLRQRKPTTDHQKETKNRTGSSDDLKAVEEKEEVASVTNWANPFTWPASVYVALLLVSAAAYFSGFINEPDFDNASPELCRSTFNYTFRINAARSQVERLSTHSWEYGTGVEAMLELDRKSVV